VESLQFGEFGRSSGVGRTQTFSDRKASQATKRCSEKISFPAAARNLLPSTFAGAGNLTRGASSKSHQFSPSDLLLESVGRLARYRPDNLSFLKMRSQAER
jgi:hypothetical protein